METIRRRTFTVCKSAVLSEFFELAVNYLICLLTHLHFVVDVCRIRGLTVPGVECRHSMDASSVHGRVISVGIKLWSLFVRNGEGTRLFTKTSRTHVYLMPSALQSSGEDRAGWLASEFTSACECEAAYEDRALLPTAGWKTPSANREPPLFVVTRVLDTSKEEAVLRFFRGM